jgi:hypothetical protein
MDSTNRSSRRARSTAATRLREGLPHRQPTKGCYERSKNQGGEGSATLEKRSGYARAALERAIPAAHNTGLVDVPDGVAGAIEELPAAPEPEPVKPDVSVEELAARLSVIKERIFRLHAVFAVSTQPGCDN